MDFNRSAAANNLLPITIDADLIIEIVDLNLRIKSMLVGMEHGDYVIAKIFANELMGRFRSVDVRESPMVVGYGHKETIYNFSTAVMGVVSSPAKLFFLKYPEKIDSVSTREMARHGCSVKAQAMLGNDLVELSLVDVSRNGCQCVITPQSEKEAALYSMMQVNKKMDIMARLPGTDGGCDLKGVIRNVGKDVKSITLGVRFENIPPESRQRLESFISNIP
jgi:hypothetical protein